MEERIRNLENNVADIDKRQAVQSADIKHIKERLDHGIGPTVTKIYTKLAEDLCPKVQSNTKVCAALTSAVWWVLVVGLCGGIIGLGWHYVQKGIETTAPQENRA